MKRSHNFFQRLRRAFRQEEAEPLLKDDFYPSGMSGLSPRDRAPFVFRDVIARSLRAWREDPLARRIVCLTTQFSVGRGFRVSAEDPGADAMLREFWEHPLNRMDLRLSEWSDELCRTGNLFIMLSSDVSGMTYARAIPAGQIEEIISLPNDIEQETAFRMRETEAPEGSRIPEERIIPAASLPDPDPSERMLHFTVNRPVGAQWGEPDLAPLLIWLDRYDQWLEDRARLNHYRSCFMYIVKNLRNNDRDSAAREMQLNRQPPTPGRIMVTGALEEWTVLHPNLDSSDANEDGLAIKKVIAAGAGIPVSFLAETTGGSRAENGGMEDSACRNFRQRQQVLMFIIETVLRHVLIRASAVRRELDPFCEIHVYGDDIAAPGMSEGGMVQGI